MKNKIRVSLIICIVLVSFAAFLISCNVADIIGDIDLGSIWEVFGYNKPANLKALAISDSQIYLSWEDKVTGEDGFKIEVTDEDLNATVISVEKNTTEYYHKPLNSDMLYIYKMYAYDGTGKSEYSNIAFAKTDVAASVAPEAPTNLQAAPISDTRIELSWDDNSSNEDGFRIRISTDDVTYTDLDYVDPNTTSYTSIGLNPETLYYHKVAAYNTFEYSDETDAASATTEATPVAVPEAPANLQAAAISNMRIDLTWADNSDNEEAFYIQIGTNGTTFTTIDKVKPNVTTYQSTSLKPETTYYYRVYAINFQGNSDYSNIAKAKTKPTPGTIPNAPSNLQAKAVSDSQIMIGWIDNSTDEDGFNVFISKDDVDYYWAAKVKPNVTEYLMSCLAPNFTYYFKVSAYNFFGETDIDLMDPASATTLSSGTIPNAPTGLVAKAYSDTQIAIAWTDNSNNEEGFNIEISKGGSFVWLTKVKPDTREYLVSGLGSGITYSFRVNAYNKYGASDYSNTAKATTLGEPTGAPAAPTNLVAKGASDTRIDMAWTDNSDNEDGFNIEVSEDGIRFEFLDKVGPDVNEYSLGGLKPNLTLIFRVNAFNRVGKSEYSNLAKATTLSEPAGAPAAPSNLVAKAVSYTQVAIGWTDNSDNEEGFNIVMAVDELNSGVPPNADQYRWIKTVKPDINEFLVEGLKPDITFWFKVQAFNGEGKSLYSNAAGARTPVKPTEAPAAPTNLLAKAVSDTQIELGWTDNSDNEDAFNIEIAVGTVEPDEYKWIDKVKPDTTYYKVGGLKPNTQFWFRVNAVNSVDASGYTDPATATTKPEPGTTPAAPTNLVAKALSHTQIAIGWTDNSDNEDGFNIEMSINDSDYKFFDKVGANVKEYAAEGLKPKTTYFFRVNAFNSSGTSGYSNSAKATTQSEPTGIPIPPAGLEASVKSDSVIALVWKDMSDNEDGFNIELSGDDTNYKWIAKNKPNVTEYVVEGLKPDTTYWFRINAFNAKGASAYCTPVNATTQSEGTAPDAPSGLSATAKSDSVIVLSWTDNSDNEEGFVLEWGPDGSKWETLEKVKPDSVEYIVEGLKPTTVYYFRIFAYNGEGSSDYSNTANATTLESPTSPPAAPTDLTATSVGELTIIIEWTDNSAVEEGFFIEGGPDGEKWETIGKLPPDSESYKIGGLKEGITYYFRVKAYNKAGESAYSNTDSAVASSK
jgi:phosphodiesterase/alkaline phosphatase D-like protein